MMCLIGKKWRKYFLKSFKSMKKVVRSGVRSGSGSIGQRYGSGDPDPKCHGSPTLILTEGRCDSQLPATIGHAVFAQDLNNKFVSSFNLYPSAPPPRLMWTYCDDACRSAGPGWLRVATTTWTPKSSTSCRTVTKAAAANSRGNQKVYRILRNSVVDLVPDPY